MHPNMRTVAASTGEPIRLALVNETNSDPPPAQPPPPAQALTLGEAIHAYKMAYLSTLKQPASTISRLRFLAPFAERSLESLTVLELQVFFNHLAKDSPVQAYEGVKAVRHIFKKMGGRVAVVLRL